MCLCIACKRSSDQKASVRAVQPCSTLGHQGAQTSEISALELLSAALAVHPDRNRLQPSLSISQGTLSNQPLSSAPSRHVWPGLWTAAGWCWACSQVILGSVLGRMIGQGMGGALCLRTSQGPQPKQPMAQASLLCPRPSQGGRRAQAATDCQQAGCEGAQQPAGSRCARGASPCKSQLLRPSLPSACRRRGAPPGATALQSAWCR